VSPVNAVTDCTDLSHVHREPINMEAAFRLHIENVIEVGSARHTLATKSDEIQSPAGHDESHAAPETDPAIVAPEVTVSDVTDVKDTVGDEESEEYSTAQTTLPELSRPDQQKQEVVVVS